MDGRQKLGWGLVAGGVVLVVVAAVLLVGGGDDGGETVAAAEATTTSTAPTTGTTAPTTAPTTASTTAPTTTPTSPPVETPEEFFAQLGQAFRDGDVEFLFARLHPQQFDRYTEESCRTYLASLDVPAYTVEVLSVGATAPFEWTTDGLTATVPDATTVHVRFAEDGTNFREVDTHIVLIGGEQRWLTDCGEPA